MPDRVVVVARVLRQAADDFPSDRSDEGRPSLVDFVEGPLAAAQLVFSQKFDQAPRPLPGLDALRQWDTLSIIFGPVLFFALRTSEHIEIVSYVFDPDYWETVGDDPRS